MIVGVGIDIIEIERIEKAISRSNKFIEKVFTENERVYFGTRNNRIEVITGNFAAKEAIVKAIGVGFVDIGLKDVEVLRDPFGKPYVVLYNKAKAMLSDTSTVHISISHCKDYAVANATIESLDKSDINEMEFSLMQKLQ